MKHTLTLCLASLLLLGANTVTTAHAADAATPRPPNIIIMNTDDQGQWAVGAYGNKEIHTPNMDRLAREGMRFTHAFSKPVCSPSRAMTLTGQYSHRLGIPDYIPYGNPVFADNGLPAGTPTIASVLKAAGYTSALIGKWHLGYGEKYYPERFGFDVAEGHHYIAPGKQYAGYGQLPVVIDGREVKDFNRDPRHTDILTDRAIHFIGANRAQPFFLFFNTYVPHDPWNCAPEEDLAHYKDRTLTVPDLSRFPEAKMTQEELQQMTRFFYGHVTCADRNLGRLLAALEEMGLAENTLLIFMSDNGMNLGQHGLLGKGNASILGVKPRKTGSNMFDRSVLVPFIVRWPGVVKAGATSDALVSSIDILPTLMAATGAGAGQGLKLDGRSLLPLLKGERGVTWRDFYCDTYDMIYLGNNGEKPHMRMVRTDRWKLVLHLDADGHPLDNGSRHELFDLKGDTEELTNLYGKPSIASTQQQLDTRLRTWMRETGVTK
ncbi:MAG: sulfatase-like hydrolase/transferase [Limisphaerales bacterium]